MMLFQAAKVPWHEEQTLLRRKRSKFEPRTLQADCDEWVDFRGCQFGSSFLFAFASVLSQCIRLHQASTCISRRASNGFVLYESTSRATLQMPKKLTRTAPAISRPVGSFASSTFNATRSEQALSRSTVDSVKATAAETAAAWSHAPINLYIRWKRRYGGVKSSQ